ncbi:hypothetical protein C0J52_26506 [Blattella germanica]|nr:hypothetical protein C0J52_26506 [Blattella germanica]
MRKLSCLLVFSTLVAAAFGIECPLNECSKVNCTREVPEDRRPPCKDNERLEHNRTFCGCCPMCVTLSGEGEFCSPYLGLSVPRGPIACKAGLSCVGATCRKNA